MVCRLMYERLTATEARLAALVASGRSDREIATALALATSAVEETLARVCRKLGVRSRTELAVLLGSGTAVVD